LCEAGEDGVDLELRLQPDGKEESFLQMWIPGYCPKPGCPPFDLHITPPGCGPNPAALWTDEEAYNLVSEGRTLARLYFQIDKPVHLAADPNSIIPPVWRVTLATLPTLSNLYDGPFAAPGTWRLNFRATHETANWDKLAIWVERGDSIQGFPLRGRQAYLDHPTYESHLPNGRWLEVDNPKCPVKRNGTLSGNSNACSPLAAGAYRHGGERRVAYYSAARSDVTGQYQPTIAVPAEYSAALPDVIAAGSCSGSVRRTVGTSVAAAVCSREIAKLVKKGNAHTTALAKGELQDLAFAHPSRPPIDPGQPQFPKERVGYGLVDALFERTPERRRRE
ncbi:MAG: hypothetical protein AAFN51_03205, partial [Pseudomonadota bacterium]